MVNDSIFVQLRYGKNINRIELVQHDVTIRDREDNTLLHEAAVLNDVQFGEYLLKCGLDLSIINNQGLTPLHTAANHLHFEIAKCYLVAGADANTLSRNGMSPLMLAIVAGDRGLFVQLLLSYGADPALIGPHGYSPISLAQKRNDTELVRVLTAGL